MMKCVLKTVNFRKTRFYSKSVRREGLFLSNDELVALLTSIKLKSIELQKQISLHSCVPVVLACLILEYCQPNNELLSYDRCCHRNLIQLYAMGIQADHEDVAESPSTSAALLRQDSTVNCRSEQISERHLQSTNVHFLLQRCDLNLYDRVLQERTWKHSDRNWAVWIEIVREIIDGLHELHSGNKFHGELHCGNVLFHRGEDGLELECVKLSDFGILRRYVPEDDYYFSKEPDDPLYEPVRFVAPEVLAGQKKTVEADIWSLGMLLYFILTCQLPFPHKTSTWVIIHVQKQRPTLLAEDFPFAKVLVRMMDACLSSPSARPSASALQQMVS